MSRRLKSLETVKRLAVTVERREVARLAEYMQRHADKNQKLEYIKQYFDEYAGALATKAGHGISVANLRLHRGFVNQLDAALGQQSSAVEAAERLLAEQRERWMAAKRKVDAIEDLIARQKVNDTKQAAKLEQRVTDDFAGQKWTRER